ncbi:hypothetical protein C8R45DRAFT_254044 [Mycena sanguinolenta]|nr:hypothetical protein C8R45DRAFT_254044 [Mycena sanguinolenta]
MYLRCRFPQHAVRAMRSFHSSASTRSTYRGYNMHGTLCEWALRMINKEDLQYAARARDSRRVQRHRRYAEQLMELADSYVLAELTKAETHKIPPTGKPGRTVRTADRLISGASNPFEARGRREGKKAAGDRVGRLKEALRLYLRAAQRADGSMPVISSRVWGTTHFLERRILNTVKKTRHRRARTTSPLYASSYSGYRQLGYTAARKDTTTGGAAMGKDEEAGGGASECPRPRVQILPPLATPTQTRALCPRTRAHAAARSIPRHRERRRAGVGARTCVLCQSRLLGTPPPPSDGAVGEDAGKDGGEQWSATPPTAFANGGPLPYYTYPGPAPSSSSNPSPLLNNTSDALDNMPARSYLAPPDPTTLRGPPWTRRGKMLRWVRPSKKREGIIMRYFPVGHPPAPVAPNVGRAVPTSSAAAMSTRDASSGEQPGGHAQPSLAHALRVRLAGRVRV